MVRGTRYLLGKEADCFQQIVGNLRQFCKSAGYQEFIPSALAEQHLFIQKAGKEIVDQMYGFPDKKGRPLCLIPEVTAVAQSLYREHWSKDLPKPVRIFYQTRCYRYERPQLGRYREFWQFGVESMGGETSREESIELLRGALISCGCKNFTINDMVKRGLSYYVEDGFEAEVAALGAQKQVAGGGRYDVGIGWAIGIDRLLLTL